MSGHSGRWNDHKLNCSGSRFTDERLKEVKRELVPRSGDEYPYEEVDFSQNELSSVGLKIVLDICRRCPKLRVLKLYKNQIDDGGAEGLAELFKLNPWIEEIHLSHNHFTAAGVEVFVTAAEQARPDNIAPLWIRLERNDIADPSGFMKHLQSQLSVCPRHDEVRCTARVCCKKMKIHLPYLHAQNREATANWKPVRGGYQGYDSGYRNAGGTGGYKEVSKAEASPAAAVMTPSRSLMADKTPAAKAAGFAAAKAKAVTGSPASWSSAVAGGNNGHGYGSDKGTNGHATASVWGSSGAGAAKGAAAQTERPAAREKESTVTPAPRPVAKPKQDGLRPSLVLDETNERRIVPEQLENVGASSQLVCSICSFVVKRPVITSCSHLFCDTCFRKWVTDQVNRQKVEKASGEAPVPVIPCPQQKCQSQLRKKDIMPMDKADASKGAVQLLKRMRNNLQLRCVHHVDNFDLACGADAKWVQRKTGMSCKWTGDMKAYEEHITKQCPIERFLEHYKEEGASDAHGNSEQADHIVAASKSQSKGNSTANDDKDADAAGDAECEVRIARYDYNPRDTDKAQLRLKAKDLVKIFETTDSGWAAGICVNSAGEEIGEAGWFPTGYLFPPQD